MDSKSISGVTSIISSKPDRFKHVLAHVEVTPDSYLDSMKYKGSLIFGSVYILLICIYMIRLR